MSPERLMKLTELAKRLPQTMSTTCPTSPVVECAYSVSALCSELDAAQKRISRLEVDTSKIPAILAELAVAQKRIAELNLLVVDLSTISTRQRSMQIEYPAGTANAEDAWSEFSKWEKSVYARAAALLAEKPQ